MKAPHLKNMRCEYVSTYLIAQNATNGRVSLDLPNTVRELESTPFSFPRDTQWGGHVTRTGLCLHGWAFGKGRTYWPMVSYLANTSNIIQQWFAEVLTFMRPVPHSLAFAYGQKIYVPFNMSCKSRFPALCWRNVWLDGSFFKVLL